MQQREVVGARNAVANGWAAARGFWRRSGRVVRASKALAVMAAVVLAVEATARQSFTAPVVWLVTSPVEALLNGALLACVLGLFVGLTGRLRAGAIVGLAGLALVASVHAAKQLVLGEPLQPWDLTLAREASYVVGRGYVPFRALGILSAVAALAVAVFALSRMPAARLRPLVRVATIAGVVCVLTLGSFHRSTPVGAALYRVVNDYRWDQSYNYRANGFALAFLINVQASVVVRPAGYSAESMARAVARIGVAIDYGAKAPQAAYGPGATDAAADGTDGEPAAASLEVDIARTASSDIAAPPDGALPTSGATAFAAAAAALDPADAPTRGADAARLPNLIILVNESFADPRVVFPNVTFEPDPLPRMRALEDEHTRFDAISPSFGGGTCNAEMELLTGLSIASLPRGAIPYQQYIQRPLPSFASLLRARGYRTVAVHAFHRWFWNRDRVYPRLGFERFIALDDVAGWGLEGDYVADRALVQTMLDVIDGGADVILPGASMPGADTASSSLSAEIAERGSALATGIAAADADAPLFLFGLTMQNHGPYEHRDYGPDGPAIEVQGDLPEDSRHVLQRYAQGLSYADEALGMLIERVQRLDRPTLVVHLGDHLPYLGRDYQVYREAGLVRPTGAPNAREAALLRTVPVVIWSNYGARAEVAPRDLSFLMPVIWNLLGLEAPPFVRFLDTVASAYPVLGDRYHATGDGVLLDVAPPWDLAPVLVEYTGLHYDLLFGRRFALEPLFEVGVDALDAMALPLAGALSDM